MTPLAILTVLTVALNTGCMKKQGSESSAKPKVWNGEKAPGSLQPHAAVIVTQNDDGTGEVCSGVFITETDVLTAGHCKIEANSTVYWPVIINGKLSPTCKVKKVNAHPMNDDRKKRVDLAVVHVDCEGRLDGEVFKPAVIAHEAVEIKATTARLVGYGFNEGGSFGSGRSVVINVENSSNAVGADAAIANVDDTGNGTEICSMDSGSPVYALAAGQHQLLFMHSGVASGVERSPGIICSGKNLFEFFVPRHLSWIKKVAKNPNQIQTGDKLDAEKLGTP